MTPTPKTPAQLRAEQERWQGIVERSSRTRGSWRALRINGEWIVQAGDGAVPILRADGTTYGHLPAYHAAEQKANVELAAAAPALARAHADLLGQMAEMLERLEGLAAGWQQEVDEDYAPDYYFDEYEPAARAAEKLHWCAKELRALLPAPPQAQASADAGGEG